jgi:hypothetical protein
VKECPRAGPPTPAPNNAPTAVLLARGGIYLIPYFQARLALFSAGNAGSAALHHQRRETGHAKRRVLRRDAKAALTSRRPSLRPQ